MATSSLNRRVRDEATAPALRLVLYLRVSSKRQMDTDADRDPDGNSIDTQRKWCLDKARQMGAIVVDEYVEPGNSAQTIDKRPVFRDMMRRIQTDCDVDGVLIYMRSRAFRNYIDAGNTEAALGKLGVKLISAKEEFGDGPMAEAMKAITDVFNWLQVRLSGDDIKVKMGNKARNGGTIGRAPVGYLNVTKTIDDHKVNTVIIDPDRHHFIPMAFELWASGEYPNIKSLRAELTRAGLRMPRTGKPIGEQTLCTLLRDRYYLGYVTYDGIEYLGRHEPLITDPELFERAQRVFDTHSGSGTRQRSHNHYLRGTIWCGRCRHRFIVQRAVGRRGGVYFYFYCRGRQEGFCDQPSIPVEVMEAAVLAYYGDALTLPADWLAQVRAGVDEAVSANCELSDALRQQHAKRLEELDRKEDYFLDLAAEQGWPKDKLRSKIDTVRHERSQIEDTLNRAEQQRDRSRDVFYAALDLLAEPQRAYEHGNETVRTILNKAFFTRLYADAGKVIDHEAQEPFGALLDGYHTYYVTRTANRSTKLPKQPDTPASGRSADSTLTLAVQGWSKPAMVGDVEALSRPSRPAGRLLQMAATWPDSLPAVAPKATTYRTMRRLRAAEVGELVAAYRGGATVYDLAARFGIDRKTVGKHLRTRGVDTTPPGLHPADVAPAADLYRAGWSLERIAEKLGTTANTVRARLLEVGVRMRDPQGRAHIFPEAP